MFLLLFFIFVLAVLDTSPGHIDTIKTAAAIAVLLITWATIMALGRPREE